MRRIRGFCVEISESERSTGLLFLPPHRNRKKRPCLVYTSPVSSVRLIKRNAGLSRYLRTKIFKIQSYNKEKKNVIGTPNRTERPRLPTAEGAPVISTIQYHSIGVIKPLVCSSVWCLVPRLQSSKTPKNPKTTKSLTFDFVDKRIVPRVGYGLLVVSCEIGRNSLRFRLLFQEFELILARRRKITL